MPDSGLHEGSWRCRDGKVLIDFKKVLKMFRAIGETLTGTLDNPSVEQADIKDWKIEGERYILTCRS
jgi:hypothetical protein